MRIGVLVGAELPYGGGLSKLGECMDMIDIEERAFWRNVPGDRYGQGIVGRRGGHSGKELPGR